MSTRIKSTPSDVIFDIDENTHIEWSAEDNKATIIQESDGVTNHVNVTFDNVYKLQTALGDCDTLMELIINHK